MSPRRFVLSFITVIFVLGVAFPTWAQRPTVIRDAEIENLIRDMSAPLFRAGGLNPNSVSIHIILDKSLNAFVANGQRMFMHTGLLMQSDNANQIIGVIAHEAGHITGGHISRFGDAFNQATTTTVLSTLLGAAAAIGTGRADVGAAITAGGSTLAQRNFLAFTRTQESSADQAALTLLDATGQSSRGLMTFLEKLVGQELLVTRNQDPYARTHPLSEERVDTMRAHLERSPHADAETPSSIELRFARMQAKLRGYFDPPQQTFRLYPEADMSIPAQYARAYAYSRVPEPQKALATLETLLQQVPGDPYFLELKGQVLLESQDVPGAIAALRLAVANAPDANLIMNELARALMAAGDDASMREAIEVLRQSLARESQVPGIWRRLGVAYGTIGDIGRSSLALAESAILRGERSEVQFHAGRAADLFPRGSAEWLQAQDLLLAIQTPENR